MYRNSVFSRELVRSGRSLRLYVLRCVVPLAISLLLLGFFAAGDPQAGIHAFQWLVYLFHGFALIAMPLLVSSLLHEEWEGNTFPVLVLTEMSLASVLRGLLASRVLLLLANLVACFPLLISIMIFGGVTAAQLAQFSILMLSLTILYGAVALWSASVSRRRERTLGLLYAVLVAPQAAALYLVQTGVASSSGLVGWIPIVAFERLTTGTLPWTPFASPDAELSGWIPGGASSAVTSSGRDWLVLNVAWLGAAVVFFLFSQRRWARGLSHGAPFRGDDAASAPGKAHEPIRSNPLGWLVLKRFDPLLGIPPRWAVLGTLALALAIEVIATVSNRRDLLDAMGVAGLLLMSWTLYWAMLVSAQTWVEERAQGTLELLLATPFSLDEILLWKVDAVFWILAAPTLMYSFLLFGFVPTVGGSLAQLFLLVPFTICCFLYSYVVLMVIAYVTVYFSIRAKNTVEAVLMSSGFFAGIGSVNFFTLYLGSGTGVVGILLLLDVVFLAAFFPLFRARLRDFEPS